jgi:hypothetical protein
MKSDFPPEWHRLFNAALNDQLTDAERAELAAVLKSSAEARQLWFLYQDNECSLAELKPRPQVKSPRTGFSWLSWRPLTAAAAGIVFGMLCTSVVFGFVMPRAVATASRLFALVDGSFEKQTGRVAVGFPSEFGVWSGDEAEAADVAVVDGRRALRFVRAERELALPDYGAASCDVYQLVDLRPLKADAALGDATLELSAQFRDAREMAGEKMKFICQLYVFTGPSDALPAEWPLTQKQALASGSGTWDSLGGSPSRWQQVSTKSLLPAGADFAVVHLVVHHPNNPPGATASFGKQFADDVRLTFKTQPVLPVRLARR